MTEDSDPIEDNLVGGSDASASAAETSRGALRVQLESSTPIAGRCRECGAEWQGEPSLMQIRVDPIASDVLLFAVRPDFRLREVTDEFKKRLMLALLRQTGGRVKAAAGLADMKYTTFYTMMRRLGIDPEAVQPRTNGKH